MAESSKGYGYRVRPDPSQTIDPGAVALPRREWPRGIGQAIREGGGAGGYTDQLIYMLGPGTELWRNNGGGINVDDFATGGTLTKTEPGWWAAVKRAGLVTNLVSTTGNICTHRYGPRLNYSPKAFVDPDTPAIPLALIVEDVVCARGISPAAGHVGGMNFGLSWENAAPATGINPYPWIGFQVQWTYPDTSELWRCNVKETDGSVASSKETSVDCGDPHHLRLELSGDQRVINWYIDGVQVHSYAPSAGEVMYHTIYRINGPRYTLACYPSGAEVQALYKADFGCAVKIRAL